MNEAELRELLKETYERNDSTYTLVIHTMKKLGIQPNLRFDGDKWVMDDG